MTKSNLWNIILLLLLGVAVYILFKQNCGHKPSIVTPVSTQVEKYIHDSTMSAHQKDSVNFIVEGYQKSAIRWYKNFQDAGTEIHVLEENMNNLLTMEVPDTCKPLQAILLEKYNNLLTYQATEETACNETIEAKDGIISEKDILLAISREDFRRMKQELDTAWLQQTKLQKSNTLLNPKREINLGFKMNIYPKLGVGPTIGYQDLKGYNYQVGLMFSNSGKSYNFGISKSIFHF